MSAQQPMPLKQCVEQALEAYFKTLDGHPANGLYDLFMREVEQPLLAGVMRECGGNQTHAAQVLGVSRGTLRKKLREHGLD